jgi:hypothetical protein
MGSSGPLAAASAGAGAEAATFAGSGCEAADAAAFGRFALGFFATGVRGHSGSAGQKA